MNRYGLILAACGVLAGCQEQRTVVLEQASAGSLAAGGLVAAPRPRPVVPPLSPCSAPRGTGPFEHTQRPPESAPVRFSERAIAENVAGCAGVRFRIGRDGAAHDVTVMAEYPLGYGFGETARQALEVSRWPPRDDLAWHYIIINRLPSRPAG